MKQQTKSIALIILIVAVGFLFLQLNHQSNLRKEELQAQHNRNELDNREYKVNAQLTENTLKERINKLEKNLTACQNGEVVEPAPQPEPKPEQKQPEKPE